jgi:hypothetical protein
MVAEVMAWWIIGTTHLQGQRAMPPPGNRPGGGENSATSGRTETRLCGIRRLPLHH